MSTPWIGKSTTQKQKDKIAKLNKNIELSTLKWATEFLNSDIERLREINKITDEYVQCVMSKRTLLPRDVKMVDKLSTSIIARMTIIDKMREDYVKKEAAIIKEMLKEQEVEKRYEIIEEFKKEQKEQEIFTEPEPEPILEPEPEPIIEKEQEIITVKL